MNGIFSDLRVLEFASVLAGPSVGMFFAELGAEVIKIEHPLRGGDVTRSWKLPGEQAADGVSAYFSSVNWGKESLSLDLRSTAGREMAYRLVQKADITIMSFKPGDQQKLGLDYEKLQTINPQIICAEISAYGERDPRVGFDAIIQAESGFTFMNGEPEGPPVKMPVALVDVLAAHQLKEAILVALLRRTQSQKGSRVQVSLLRAAVAALVNQGSNFLVGGHIPQRMGSEHPNIVPYGSVMATADGKELVLAVGNDRQFQGLCRVLGEDAWAQDPRFLSNPDRVKHKAALLDLLRAAIQRFERDPLLEALAEAKVPAGAIRDMREVFEQAPAQAQLLEGESMRGIRGVAWEDSEPFLKEGLNRPPIAGGQSRDVLSRVLGMSGEEIDKFLREQKDGRG